MYIFLSSNHKESIIPNLSQDENVGYNNTYYEKIINNNDSYTFP